MKQRQFPTMSPAIDSLVRTGVTPEGKPLGCAFTPASDYHKAAQCNPGIQRTVLWLMGHDFDTSDSGDGKTRLYECDRDHAYVVVKVAYPADLLYKLDHLTHLLGALQIPVRPIGTRYVLGLPPDQQVVVPGTGPVEQGPHVEIQASIDAGDRSCLIDISYLDDAMLVAAVQRVGRPR